VGLACYGLGSGGAFYYKLARAPFAAATQAPYYRASLLHVGLAHALGLTASILAFRVFVLAWWWAALVHLGVLLRARLSLTDTLLLLCVATTHPAAMIVHAWTCHPDALTLLLTTALLFARRPAVIATIAALGAWNHAAMWTVIIVQTALLWWAFADDRLTRRALALAGGLLLGLTTARLTLWLCAIHITRDRLDIAATQSPDLMLARWTDPGLPVLYTLHFAHLLWLPPLLLLLRRHHPRAALALIATQLLALAACTVSEDTTRVFACLAWSAPLYCLYKILPTVRGATNYLRPLLLLAVLLSLLGPHQFAWKGALHDLDGARAHLRALLGR
jgi:hypothetical protein